MRVELLLPIVACTPPGAARNGEPADGPCYEVRQIPLDEPTSSGVVPRHLVPETFDPAVLTYLEGGSASLVLEGEPTSAQLVSYCAGEERLDVEVRLRVTSGDGAVAEEVTVMLSPERLDGAWRLGGRGDVDPEDLTGSLFDERPGGLQLNVAMGTVGDHAGTLYQAQVAGGSRFATLGRWQSFPAP